MHMRAKETSVLRPAQGVAIEYMNHFDVVFAKCKVGWINANRIHYSQLDLFLLNTQTRIK